MMKTEYNEFERTDQWEEYHRYRKDLMALKSIKK